MIRNGSAQVETRHNSLTVLQAYFANTNVAATDEEFLKFWNSLSEMEKDYYLNSNLPQLFYTSGAA